MASKYCTVQRWHFCHEYDTQGQGMYIYIRYAEEKAGSMCAVIVVVIITMSPYLGNCRYRSFLHHILG
jgi:hypothetical protein